MIKIHFTYKHVDKPWGGANNFIRALREELSAKGCFEFTRLIDEDFDVLFMNQLGTGPGGLGESISLGQVKALVGKPSTARRRKLVVRAVNLNWHAFPIGPRNFTVGWWRDRQTVALLNLADVAIFQSAYQREFFEQAGYRGGNDIVIHNGAAESFWVEQPAHPPLDGNLRFVSSTASPRASKGHDLIARLSMVDGVEVNHLGNWPDDGTDPGRVRLLGMQASEQMITAMSSSHYFLHSAVKDPCPNAVFEAVCAGLPVVYHPGPGSSREIVGDCGIAIDESDLVETVVQARRQLAALRTTVLAQRDRFAISNAAARYRAVFEQVIKGQT